MGRRQKKQSPLRKILCELMDSEGLSVRKAAQIAGVPVSTVANWRGGAIPDDHLALRRLADHFGVTLGFLLTGLPDHPDVQGMIYETFERGNTVFDGIAKITIQTLVPRKRKKPPLPPKSRTNGES